MPTPIEAYREGYERGRNDSAGGRLAELTMGMLRDDPGGHFQKGYSDGAAGKPFSPPSIPTPSRRRTEGFMPKFSENPFGWFFGVLIVIELWTLWQLIKAPFQLIASLMRNEKPSPWVVVKNIIVAGLVIALVWWVPHLNETRGPAASPAPTPIGSDPASHFGPTAIWNPPDIVRQRIQSDCMPAQGPAALTTCVTGIMQETGASADAIRFTRLLRGEGYMTDFRQAGNLGIATTFYPFRANDNDSVCIVNGSPALVDPDQLSANIDIRNDALYPSLAAKYPQVMSWPHAAFKEARATANGEQLVFGMVLLNGCHACEVAGAATVALDFDGLGRLLGTRLLGLSPPEPDAHPSPPAEVPVSAEPASSPAPSPSFNCAAAKTAVEKLICRDGDLAVLERSMADAYRRALQMLPDQQRSAFRREHLDWFKTYARTCNALADAELRACVVRFLSDHTKELQTRLQ
jgi:uncharacterized protein YecT (DUF1311 family)